MRTMRTIHLAEEFSPFPFGRYPEHGPWSGQKFRDEVLVPALQGGEDIVVDLDGAHGLSPSFLEETFGGLVRSGFSETDLKRHLKIKSDRDPTYASLIAVYIRSAATAA